MSNGERTKQTVAYVLTAYANILSVFQGESGRMSRPGCRKPVSRSSIHYGTEGAGECGRSRPLARELATEGTHFDAIHANPEHERPCRQRTGLCM